MFRRGFLRLLLGTVFAVEICLVSSGVSVASGEEKEVAVGGLFSLTGNWKTLGMSSKAAMEMAVEDANAEAKSRGLSVRFKAIILDTALSPEKAAKEMTTMSDKGVRFVIGPQSSSELAAVKDIAGSKGIIAISQSSTAGRLAVANDNIYRFCPGDELEARAVSTFMRRDGIKAIVPVWRDDPGNDGLAKEMGKTAAALGWKVSVGVKYAATTNDWEGVVKKIAADVEKTAKQSGSSAVAVYLAGFDETGAILAAASGVKGMEAVKWYGSDGSAMSKALTDNAVAAAFAEKVKYQCPIFGVEANARLKSSSIISRLEAKAGTITDGYALAVYDAVRVVADTAIALEGKLDDIEKARKEFVKTANSHRGITGRTVLNAAGDRKYGSYDFWAVNREGAGYKWKLVGSYESE